MNTKAQIEIVGLLVIVLLIILGALFYLKFVILQPTPPASESTMRTTQAYNLLNALIPLHLCEEKTLKQALVQCAERPSEPLCAGKTSCDALHTFLPAIVDPVMRDALALNYSFTARTEDREFFTLPGCATGVVPRYTFEEEGKIYELSFKLCKR